MLKVKITLYLVICGSLSFRILLVANTKQSFNVTIECMTLGTTTKSTNFLDLKNPYFRYTGVQPPPPPGENNQSPSEAYWTQVDMQGARQVSFMA